MIDISDKRTGFGSHLPPLINAVLRTKGIVIELGAGNYSTPILHEICKIQKRVLFTFENDKTWLEKFIDLKTKRHRIIYVDNWDEVTDIITQCDVALIDHAPEERRIVDIRRLKDIAKVMVIHDAEREGTYHYSKIWGLFRYVKKYKQFKKQTALVSNTIDVREFI